MKSTAVESSETALSRFDCGFPMVHQADSHFYATLIPQKTLIFIDLRFFQPCKEGTPLGFVCTIATCAKKI